MRRKLLIEKFLKRREKRTIAIRAESHQTGVAEATSLAVYPLQLPELPHLPPGKPLRGYENLKPLFSA